MFLVFVLPRRRIPPPLRLASSVIAALYSNPLFFPTTNKQTPHSIPCRAFANTMATEVPGNAEQQLAPQNATIRHPIQELRFCAANGTLYASSAGQLWALSPTRGEVLRRWKAPSIPTGTVTDSKLEHDGQRKKSKRGKDKIKQDVSGKEEEHPTTVPQMAKNERSVADASIEKTSALDLEAARGPSPHKPVPMDDEMARRVGSNTSYDRPSQRRRLTNEDELDTKPADTVMEDKPVKEGQSAKASDTKMSDNPPREKPSPKEGKSPRNVDMGDAPAAVTEQKPKEEVPETAKKPDRHPRVIVNTIGYMILTSDGSYIVTATLEDKTIRVLETHKFEVINEWVAVKRPCGLAFADEESTVLVGDKFGDVYAHALHPPRSRGITPEETSNEDVLREMASDSAAPDTTNGNGNGSDNKNSEAPRKLSTTPPPYESKPLLGHVSMLTALAATMVPPTGEQTQAQTYILTADRDEHIRVTNYPQSYDIEGYCLGHKSFVSRLYIPRWDERTLISGGGDDFLLVWDWAKGKIKQKIDLRGPLEKFLKEDKEVASPRLATKRKRDSLEAAELEEDNKEAATIAVNGIWPGPLPRTIIVGLERIPAMFLFKQKGVDLEHEMTLALRGPILSCEVDANMGWLWVAVDFAHALLQKFELVGKDPEDYQIYETTKVDKVTQFVNSEMTFSGVRVGSIGEEGGHPDEVGKRLYTVEAMRKHGAEDFVQ